MYSIPVYALRFAAYCRSRLRIAELSQADATPRQADTAQIWIRFARTRDRLRADCSALHPPRGRA